MYETNAWSYCTLQSTCYHLADESALPYVADHLTLRVIAQCCNTLDVACLTITQASPRVSTSKQKKPSSRNSSTSKTSLKKGSSRKLSISATTTAAGTSAATVTATVTAAAAAAAAGTVSKRTVGFEGDADNLTNSKSQTDLVLPWEEDGAEVQPVEDTEDAELEVEETDHEVQKQFTVGEAVLAKSTVEGSR
jgi:hypothetical protein